MAPSDWHDDDQDAPVRTSIPHGRTAASAATALLLALAVLLPAAAAPPAAAAATRPLLGVHAGDPAGVSVPERVQRYEDLVQRDVDVVNVFHSFSDTWLVQTASGGAPTVEQRLLAAGHTLMVSWRATDPAKDSEAARLRRASDLAAGLHDANLRTMARGLAALDGRVLLRFNWEMDQPTSGNQHIGTPTEFVAAWRHVHAVVSAIAPQVEWVWAPRANSFNKGEGQRYWPGSGYVDHIGGSAVPVASSGTEGAWRGPDVIFDGVVDFARAKKRPLLVWIGVREKLYDPAVDGSSVGWTDDPGWKATFIRDLQALAAGPWRDVLGTLLWYHDIAPYTGADFRVHTSGAATRAMRRLVCDPVFGGCGSGSTGSTGGASGSTGSTGSTGSATDLFTDDDGSVHEGAINWLATEGITLGCNPPANTRFCPDDPVTRAQMASFLSRALPLRAAAERFDDVGGGHTHAAAIGALAASGITRGCNPPANTRFCPDDPVTRAQMASFLSRALPLRAAAERFDDVGGGDTHAAAIGALAAAGITRGCNPPANTWFCPDDPVTRAQMASFLQRALG